MVIGSGDIASALTARQGITFFASGVSNSLCTDQKEFDREKELLNKVYKLNKENRLVYFSTLSIYEKDTPYTKHKRNQEEYIKWRFPKYCIIRIGNITWGINPHTIINKFKADINNGVVSRIDDGHKHLCDEDEFKYWMKMIPDFNTEMNITGINVHVKWIYQEVKDGRL